MIKHQQLLGLQHQWEEEEEEQSRNPIASSSSSSQPMSSSQPESSVVICPKQPWWKKFWVWVLIGAACFLFVYYWWTKEGMVKSKSAPDKTPPPPGLPWPVPTGKDQPTDEHELQNQATIFVSVASYRDKQCLTTVEELFGRAKYPERLLVCVFQQNREHDPVCLLSLNHQTKWHIPEGCLQILHTDASNAKGPAWARSILAEQALRIQYAPLQKGRVLEEKEEEETLYPFAVPPKHSRSLVWKRKRQQQVLPLDYFFMIDSHMRFVEGWDEELVQMHRRMAHWRQDPSSLPTRYPHMSSLLLNQAPSKFVLSSYPIEFDVEHNQIPVHGYTDVCLFTGMNINNQMLVPAGVKHPAWNEEAYVHPQCCIAAGFFFAPMRVLEEVPFDPHLEYLFQGEEILYSVRLFAGGWDILAPSKNLSFHYYTRDGEPRPEHEIRAYETRRKEITQAVRSMLRLGNLPPQEPSSSSSFTVAPPPLYSVSPEVLTRYYNLWEIDPTFQHSSKKWC